MTTELFVAIALCIGSPGEQMSPTVNGVSISACDIGVHIDGSIGISLEECRARLKGMHDRGNIVKFCAVKGAYIEDFSVEWAERNRNHE